MGKARHLGLSVVASALLALGLTWPLGSVMASAFAGSRPLDSWLFIWNLWWVSHAITALHTNPFVTPLLYYPDGAPLYLHTLAFVPGLVAMPVSLLGGPIIAYNVSVLIALALAGCATYWLARRWTGPLGAAVAGLAFAAAPWLLHQLRIGHLNLASAGWYVLALLLLLRATDTGRWRDRLLGALGVIAAVLVDWQWAVFLLVAGGVIAVERIWTVRRDQPLLRRRLVDLGAIGLLVTVPLLPLLVAALRFSRSIPATEYEELQIERLKYSADLLAYVMPQLLHPLWGTHVNAWLVEHPLGAVTDGRVAVSLVALALALAALALRRPGVWLWLTIGLAGLVLSLGSTLHIGGVDTGLPLPYALLADVPPLSFSRTPARFAVLPTLAVAVLAGIGLEAIARRARRWPRPAARLLPAALVGLLAFELLPVPYPIEQVPSLELAGQVRAMAGSGAVLELPYGADDTQRMLYQTIHARPIFEGYTSRTAEHVFLADAPVLANLMDSRREPDIVPAIEQNPLGVLATYHVSLIVVYNEPYMPVEKHDHPLPDQANLRDHVQELLGVAGPDWENETGAIYRVPPAEPLPVFAFPDGWFVSEQWFEGRMRWLGPTGLVRVDRPRPEALRLTFTAWSFFRPRTLTVLAGDRPLLTQTITLEPKPVTLTVPPGPTTVWLRFTVAEGAEAPIAVGQGQDPRTLSIGVANMRVDPPSG